jgi:predicted nucleic acid-binding protein
VAWIDEALHKQDTSAMLAANRRDLSLVDCTSFEVMWQLGLEVVFTFDAHFGEQGFVILPGE